MLHSAKAVTRELQRLSRDAGSFDASRYFRAAPDLGFYNCGTAAMRGLARSVYATNRDRWSIDDAMAFADRLIANRFLEAKAVGIEVVARYRHSFSPSLLKRWKRWLAHDHSANWATSDAICGALIGPLLLQFPEHSSDLGGWSKHRNLWVRRASIVGLIPLARRGQALDQLYEIASRLHPDDEDLIQKAVGWALREAGKADMARLERHLRAGGPAIPRTTLRYAIERFPPAKRAALLKETRERNRQGTRRTIPP
jgi:3-methyladenine DNA glycosylase AlkD